MIELKNVTKKYGQHMIFEGINLTFEAGKSYALIGKSGSGKSTLLNGIARLEKLTAGEVLLDGKNIWQGSEKAYFKKELGYVFQNYALVDDETVGQNLKMVEKSKEIQIETLEKVGLTKEHLKAKVFELSGGQAQRVAIARVLLKKPRVILADEPTGALDQKTGEEIRELLLSLVSSESVLIFATHDPKIYEYVDVMIDMKDLNDLKEVNV